MALFGTSGIRLECPARLTAEMAMEAGRAAAVRGKPFVAGHDGRPTGHMLKAALMAGAASAGARVIDIGFCATPTLALHTKKCGGRGAMVTASHNPPQYNGIKLFENGVEAPKAVEKEVEEALLGGKRRKAAKWNDAGQISCEEEEAREAHAKLLLSLVDVKLIAEKNPKVAVDCGNAGASALMPSLLERAGCTVIAINSSEPGKFSRKLEPTAENLKELSMEIVECGAEIGIAHDGDADRAIILDEKGKMLGQDAQLPIAVGEMLGESGAKNPVVVSTVESSLALREIVEARKARLEITPVGSLHVAERMRKGGAVFGGEPCGEYVFPKGVMMPDGLMAGLFFVEILCRHGRLSSLAGRIKVYPIVRDRLPCGEEKKGRALALVEKSWPFSKPSKSDGLRSDEEWGWALVRPSGTEPIMRITLEAKTDAKARQMHAQIRKVVEKALEEA